MIDIDQALQWLNWESPSAIPASIQYWIGRISDSNVPVPERIETIGDLIKLVESLEIPFERAEILSHCGAQGYKLDLGEEAVDWLGKAADLYEFFRDPHRQATVLWILFLVQRSRSKYRQAFDLARRARRLFTDQANGRMLINRSAEESWYRGRILDMTCDLVSAPEDMFECLFEFNGSYLSPPASQIKNRIARDIEGVSQINFQKTKSDIKLLLGVTKRSVRPQETAEALAFCGVISWILDDQVGAVNFFRSAMTCLLPSSFEYAVLQWMLGLALFQFPEEYASAIVAMDASIEGFERLRLRAIHQNNNNQEDWFATHLSAMKRVLRTRVEST